MDTPLHADAKLNKARECLIQQGGAWAETWWKLNGAPCLRGAFGAKYAMQASRLGWSVPSFVQACVDGGQIIIITDPTKIRGNLYVFPASIWNTLPDDTKELIRMKTAQGIFRGGSAKSNREVKIATGSGKASYVRGPSMSTFVRTEDKPMEQPGSSLESALIAEVTE